MATKETKKPSEKLREDMEAVRVFARTGRLPLVSASEEWINPTTKRKVPGVVLTFENGECVLDPKRDKVTIDAVKAWLDEGVDPRIVDLGVTIVNNAALLAPPFPKWDVSNESACAEDVERLGLDVEKCLRYEMAKDKPRAKLVKALEVLLDKQPEVDESDEPVLD